MKNNEKVMALILAPKPTNYEVWQETGIAQATLSRIKSGHIDVNKLTSERFNKLLKCYYRNEAKINE